MCPLKSLRVHGIHTCRHVQSQVVRRFFLHSSCGWFTHDDAWTQDHARASIIIIIGVSPSRLVCGGQESFCREAEHVEAACPVPLLGVRF